MFIWCICKFFIKIFFINLLGVRLVKFWLNGNNIICLILICLNIVNFFFSGVNNFFGFLLKNFCGWGLKVIIVE